MSVPVDLATAADPVEAFWVAHATGAPVALRTSGTTGATGTTATTRTTRTTRTTQTAVAGRRVVRTTSSWVDSFATVAALTGLDRSSRVWVPGSVTGPGAGTLSLFATVLARWAGAEVVGGRRPPAGASHAHLTPAALHALLDAGLPPDGLAGTTLTVAGDRLSRPLAERAADAGAHVTHYYGAAELSFVAWGTCADDLRPFPGVEVSLREGCIWVRSPYLATRVEGDPGGWCSDPEGWACVGDRGRLSDGVLTVDGRGDDAVTTAGATVRVADIEHALADVVRGQVFAVGVPHPRLGQVMTAVLTDAADLDAARRRARGLAAAEVPRRWWLLARPPLTAAGKVDRARLAAAVRAAAEEPPPAGQRDESTPVPLGSGS